MPGRGRYLALTDIAKLAGVRVSAVSNWHKRHADFPRSVVEAGQELFVASEVAIWLGHRKIARNRLQPDEAPGTTYGARFIRNGGAPALYVAPERSSVQAETHSEWTSQLWRILDLLKIDLDFMAAVDLVLAMLHLRTTDQVRWRDVVRQSSCGTVDRALQNLRLAGHDLTLFVALPSGVSGEQRLLEAMRLFDEINLERVGPAAVFDVLLEKVIPHLGRLGGHFTPPALVRAVVEALNPSNNETVYDPACGSGEFLAASARHIVKSVSGQAVDAVSLRLATLNLSAHDIEATLHLGRPEIAPGASTGEQYDVVMSNPPFNLTLPDGMDDGQWPFGAPSRRAANFAWLQIAVHKLKPGGRAAIFMPNGTLFSGGRNAEIRARMVTAGVVEAIIAFPPGLFVATGIAVSLWLIRRPESDTTSSEVLFIDATEMGAATSLGAQRLLREDETKQIVHEYQNWVAAGRAGNLRGAADFARSVDVEEIRANKFNLMPRRYLHNDPRRSVSLAESPSARLETLQREMDDHAERTRRTRSDIDAELEALRGQVVDHWRAVRLGDICKIQTGPGMVARERGVTIPGWTPLVLPRNIRRGRLDHDGLDTVGPEIAAKLVKYRIRRGDVVCARSGTLGRHGLVQDAEDGWLLGPSSMRLRADGHDVVPEYLVHYLNSHEVQAWILSESRGSTAIPHLSITTLQELVMPLPSIATQRSVATAMDLIDTHVEQNQRAVTAAQSLREVAFSVLTRQAADSGRWQSM